MIVVDASVLTDFLLGRPPAIEAVELECEEHPHEPLHAPELIEPETLNALRKLVRNGEIDRRRASEAVRDLADVRLLRYPHEPLRPRVWGLRDNLTAYDATYVALTEALGDADLLTADGGMAKAAEQVLGAERVRTAA